MRFRRVAHKSRFRTEAGHERVLPLGFRSCPDFRPPPEFRELSKIGSEGHHYYRTLVSVTVRWNF
jgi:hypothetical protein